MMGNTSFNSSNMRTQFSSRAFLAILQLCLFFGSTANAATSILFIGNSFTFGAGSAVQKWHANSVRDLNAQGIGGMPALFQAFARQTGLDYEVALETQGGSGLDWHLQHKRDAIGQQPWDAVVMHGYSTLDADKPGDPTKLIASAQQMAAFLAQRNPAVDIRLMATWSRADQTYPATGAWHGKHIAAMALDVRAAYDRAASSAGPAVKGVIPVGQAWLRAMLTDVADANPYNGVDPGKVNLWAKDHYHASQYGSYLEALVVFGAITGRDPRVLGAGECAAYELGISAQQAVALQKVAFDELASQGLVKAATQQAASPKAAHACSRW